jgi:hypothetical protein
MLPGTCRARPSNQIFAISRRAAASKEFRVWKFFWYSNPIRKLMEGNMPASIFYKMSRSASAAIIGAWFAVGAPVSASANVIIDWDEKAVASPAGTPLPHEALPELTGEASRPHPMSGLGQSRRLRDLRLLPLTVPRAAP